MLFQYAGTAKLVIENDSQWERFDTQFLMEAENLEWVIEKFEEKYSNRWEVNVYFTYIYREPLMNKKSSPSSDDEEQ